MHLFKKIGQVSFQSAKDEKDKVLTVTLSILHEDELLPR